MAHPGSPPPTPSHKIRFEAIGEAWQLFSANMGNWIGAMVLLVVGMGVGWLISVPLFFGAVMTGISSGSESIFGFGMIFGVLACAAVVLLITGFLAAGVYRMALKEVRGERPTIGEVFSAMESVPAVIGAALLVGLLTTIGFYLCVIPGFIVMGLFALTYPIIVDQRVGTIDGMRKSFTALRPQLLMSILFFVVLGFLSEVGSVACGIGILFTMPFLFLGTAIVYRDFFPERFSQQQAPPPGPSPYPRGPEEQ